MLITEIKKWIRNNDEDCDNCGDGTGWEYHDVYGWVGCADCNDDLEKPKPTWKAIRPSLN